MIPAAVAHKSIPDPIPVTGAPVLSIVLPARNEAAGIHAAVKTVSEFLDELGLSYELIVGDSASTDGTAERALATGLPFLRVTRAELPGKGRILSHAMRTARGSIIGFLDSDLEISAEHLRPAIRAVLEGADAAIASKALDPQLAATRSTFRRVLTGTANQLIRFTLGTRLSDHQAGLKVFRREALLPALLRVRATGWLWDTELLAMMCAAGATVKEIPVETRPNRPSRFGSIGQMVSAGLELSRVCARVRLRRWFAPARKAPAAGSLQPVR